MKSILLSFLLICVAFPSSAADGPLFNGKWKVHLSVSGNESDTECTFTQQDKNVTGSCASEKGSDKASGKVDGLKISWSYDTDYQGSPLTLKYSGTLDSATNTVAGTVYVEQFGVDGEFTATQSK